MGIGGYFSFADSFRTLKELMKHLISFLHTRRESFLESFLDTHFTLQQNAFKEWLRQTRPPGEQSYRLILEGGEKTVYLSYESRHTKSHFIFIDRPRLAKETIQRHHDGETYYFENEEGTWFFLHDGGAFVIAENVAGKEITEVPPWLMMMEDERVMCLHTLRQLLEVVVQGDKEYLQEAYVEKLQNIKRLSVQGSVGVSLFVDGILRGSMIIARQQLPQGLVEAILRALRDERFVPISSKEIDNTIIQVSFFSELFLPPLFSERRRNIPLPRKGYSLTRGVSRGYYLPTIFCLGVFPTLSFITERLITEKLNAVYNPSNERDLSVFEVCQFYESMDRKSTIASHGTAHATGESTLVTLSASQGLQKAQQAGYQFLTGFVEKDTVPPSLFNPLTGTFSYHKVRVMFTVFSLVIYGKKHEHTDVLGYARRIYERSVAEHEEESIVDTTEKGFFLAYRGRLAQALYGVSESAPYVPLLASYTPSMVKEPLLLSTFAYFFLERGDVATARTYGEKLVKLFREKQEGGREIPLADFVDVVYFVVLFSLGGESGIRGILHFFLKYQNRNGSFWSTTKNNLGYGRGTAKIIEVLLRYRHYQDVDEALTRALLYISSLTIDKESFFLDNAKKELYRGGTMESETSSLIYSDIVGHLLVIKE